MRWPRKKILNIWVDSLAYIGFVLLSTTGVLMYYILPPGSGHHKTIWGWDRHTWGDIHFWTAVVFFAALALHLVLHWNWIIAVLKGKPKETGSRWRFLLGSVGLLSVLLIGIIPVLSPIQENTSDRHNGHAFEESVTHRTESKQVRGSTTLEEASEMSGVPVSAILRFLDLPSETDPQTRLGVLKAKYGFEMHRLREFLQTGGS